MLSYGKITSVDDEKIITYDDETTQALNTFSQILSVILTFFNSVIVTDCLVKLQILSLNV